MTEVANKVSKQNRAERRQRNLRPGCTNVVARRKQYHLTDKRHIRMMMEARGLFRRKK